MPTPPLEHLRRRAALLRELRTFFDRREFLEIETPLLSHDTIVDQHLDPLAVRCYADARQPDIGPRLWLQTSPELGMKRVLAAFGESIYQVTRAFRAGEIGRLHNPEFTIVEWYEVGAGLAEGMRLLSDLATTLLGRPAAQPISYRDAFLRYTGVDPHIASIDELSDAGGRRGKIAPVSPPTDRDGWLDWLLTECVEPQLGLGIPAILHDYPASQAALARVRDSDPPVAERFELYVDGIELANGYHELLDGDLLAERMRVNNQKRSDDGKFTLPETSRLLDAMRGGLPPCAGAALGFDRLVMIAVGAASIDEVIAFPFNRA